MTASTDNLIAKIALGFREVVQLVKQLRDDLNVKIGPLNLLNTSDKTSLVASVNELKNDLDGKPNIDDATMSNQAVWSSRKVDAVITKAISDVINGAGPDGDTLKELFDKIVVLAQTDSGLVSTAGVQSFTEAEKLQARENIGALSAADVGDVSSVDFAAIVEDEWLATS
ncbi:hypothetical protein [Limnohabitans sp.]|uniref:hypothetical protein n=1 Tax=Limnohabitans sp. TaxID=1907725 RepID=UPI00286FA75B|nr:hypothetical protein [Limnohabitans sp.]